MATKVVATAFGGPEVLALVEAPVGEPGPGEVAVEVRAVGTNPIDYRVYSGQLGNDPDRLPMSLGMGEGGEQNAPLGRAVIGGLLIATFTTLFFVPVVYSMLRRGEFIDQEQKFQKEEKEGAEDQDGKREENQSGTKKEG